MLLAQSTAPDAATGMNWIWLATLLLAGAALLGGFVLLMVLLFRHLHASRQFLHTERMRSLEAGIPLEAPEEMKAQAKFMHNAFWISFWLVFSVPGAALSAASVATKSVNGSIAVSIVIWIGATLVSVAAVVCATVLMIYTRSRKSDNCDGLPKLTKPM